MSAHKPQEVHFCFQMIRRLSGLCLRQSLQLTLFFFGQIRTSQPDSRTSWQAKQNTELALRSADQLRLVPKTVLVGKSFGASYRVSDLSDSVS